MDVSESKTAAIEAGRSPIVEAGLDEMIAEAKRAGRLSATTKIVSAMPGAEVVLICVGTPSREDGSLNLDHVKRAAAEVGRALREAGGFTTVVLRSTMLPGSVEGEVQPVLEAEDALKEADAQCRRIFAKWKEKKMV